MSEAQPGPLHPIERKVLSSLGSGPIEFGALVTSTGLLPDQVRRSLSWLSSKGLVATSEARSTVFTATGTPPELSLLDALEKSGGKLPMAEARSFLKGNQEFSAAMGRATSAGWVSVSPREGGPVLELKDPAGAGALRAAVSQLAVGVGESRLDARTRAVAEDLVKRGLGSRSETKAVTVEITGPGLRALASGEEQGYVERLTPDLLASARSGAEVKLRPIDVSAPAAPFFPGRRHPVRELINEVREVYVSMGFVEIAGSSIQSSFWNFDALFTPQDHPARELQDTFYIKGGRDGSLQRRGFVARVAAAHEGGGETGSKGWRYRWDVEEARRLVLRTHNTALTVRATMDSGGREARVFSVGRVYRNEPLDYKHLAELHQMEGIVIGEGLNLRHLMGILTRFYAKLGMSGVKLWPSFFPYTEPSMQVMVYHKRLGRWMEMGGSGLFRPEVTVPLGVTRPVIAWGCGLERLLMLRLGVEDIRDLYGNDVDWLRRRRDIASTQDLH